MNVAGGGGIGAGRLGVVIVGGGSGARFGNVDKVFTPLRSRPLILYSLDVFAQRPDVVAVVVVLGRHTLGRGRALLAASFPGAFVCEGGATRAESVMAGIEALPEDVDLVAVHDAARPLASRSLLERVLTVARESGAAIPVLPVTDTIHRVSVESIASTLDRARLRAAQTPQIARRDWLEHAYAMDGPETDEGGRLAAAGFPVRVVDGEPDNIKVTWPADLAIAEALLSRRQGESA